MNHEVLKARVLEIVKERGLKRGLIDPDLAAGAALVMLGGRTSLAPLNKHESNLARQVHSEFVRKTLYLNDAQLKLIHGWAASHYVQLGAMQQRAAQGGQTDVYQNLAQQDLITKELMEMAGRALGF